MVIIVTCRITGAKTLANRLARAAAAELTHYFQRIVAVEWIFEADGTDTVARGRVHARTGYYRAEGHGQALPEAVQQTLHRLEKQRRRKKELRVSKRRRPAGRRAPRPWLEKR